MKWTLAVAIGAALMVGTGGAIIAQGSKSSTQKVSVNLSNASFQDVVQWLTKQGINVAIDHAPIDKNRRFTLRLSKVPLTEAMNAIAIAMGGSWTKSGSVWVMKDSVWGAPMIADGWRVQPPKFAEEAKTPFRLANPKVDWSVETLPGDQFLFVDGAAKGAQDTSKAVEEFAQRIQELVKKSLSEGELKQAVQKAAKEFAEKMKSSGLKYGGAWQLGPNSKELDDLKLELKGLEKLKELPGMKLDLKELPELKLDLKELQKLKELPGMKLDLKELPQLKMEMKKLEEMKELKDLPKMKFEMKDLEGLKELKNLKFPSMGAIDAKKLIGSITPEQWAQHEKQGFLLPSDLNGDQRKMLGGMLDTEGWNLVFSVDGKTLKLHSSK